MTPSRIRVQRNLWGKRRYTAFTRTWYYHPPQDPNFCECRYSAEGIGHGQTKAEAAENARKDLAVKKPLVKAKFEKEVFYL